MDKKFKLDIINRSPIKYPLTHLKHLFTNLVIRQITTEANKFT